MNSSAFACTPCGKTFTGPEPYNQHVASEKHKKKVQNGPVFQSALVCEPCQMSFTGPAPMRDHMASAGHANAMARHQVRTVQPSTPEMKSIRLADSGADKISYLQCKTCNIHSFSCAKDAFCHYDSAEHWDRKRAVESGIEPSTFRPTVAAQLTSFNNMVQVQPNLPSSVLVCRAEENFEDFCKKNNLLSWM